MNDFTKILGGAVVTMGGIMFLVILGPLFGAFAGWVVGLFFGDTILGIASQLGIRNVTMWQLGAFLGFVSGFLKTKVSATVTEAK